MQRNDCALVCETEFNPGCPPNSYLLPPSDPKALPATVEWFEVAEVGNWALILASIKAWIIHNMFYIVVTIS